MQLLLPTEETSLRPLTSIPDSENDEERSQSRIAPALWTIPALGIPLTDAMPWLASLDAATLPPAMRLFAAASQLVDKMVRRGDFAPAPKGVLQFVPFWKPETQWLVAALADLVPGNLCTARFAVPDDPVYAVTQRNLIVSYIGHALDRHASALEARPGHEQADRLPREFW